MKVFISSVRRGLASERDYLPDLIRATGNVPMRFEDFGAQDLTSRGACLGGVQDADVYLLILGAEYGTEMGDSGVAATEEEFNVAMERGIPILVFVKAGIDPEPAQQDFMDRVGNYQEGRFWAGFADNAELGVRVTKALNEQQIPAPPFQQVALTHQVEVAWRSQQSSIPGIRDSHTPVLEVHVAPIEPTPLRPVAALGDLAVRLAGDARQQGFFGHGDPLDIDSDTNYAWAVRVDDGQRRGGGWNELRTDPYAGIYVSRPGAVTIFQALPRDTMGAMVDDNDLTQRFTVLLRHLVAYLPASANITIAAAIDPADSVTLGDPTAVGHRNSGTMGAFGRGPIYAPPADQIATSTLGTHLHEVARDLAARIVQQLRDTR
ncbi:DUF4062 domain-containing protein [Aeromicrobium tamlense]|uniref:DUF4062 domain-containing protein n=1 Tax=Aeromicrobium tamlense TaxID=375541 RepID=A0A8I0KHC8_9ACTN|nr:DUF4062 domain-containing protein [Aeromicrobium tamlense]MBD1270786.1 DUF4062 domain-containing protein [Aeromicrobium tamlense]NYI38178.1 hypothetical protein [Aeromicrobium tamlense]